MLYLFYCLETLFEETVLVTKFENFLSFDTFTVHGECGLIFGTQFSQSLSHEKLTFLQIIRQQLPSLLVKEDGFFLVILTQVFLHLKSFSLVHRVIHHGPLVARLPASPQSDNIVDLRPIDVYTAWSSYISRLHIVLPINYGVESRVESILVLLLFKQVLRNLIQIRVFFSPLI